MFLIEVEGVRILHCGDIGQPTLTDEQVEAAGAVDLLLIPVGGVYTVDGRQAAGIVRQLNPRIVLPLHYKTRVLKIDLQTADSFLNALRDSHSITRTPVNTLAITQDFGPTRDKPKVAILSYRPWQMPELTSSPVIMSR